MVGNTSAISPAAEASSAPAGVNQPTSTHSSPSTRGSWPSGSTARKKCVSKRISTTAGVIQRENPTSSEGSSMSMLASSRSSRTAAARWASSPAPSTVSTAPPGNTHTPPMNLAFGVRRTSSTSSASAPPRSTITLAAWRGRAGAPVFSLVPGSTPAGAAGPPGGAAGPPAGAAGPPPVAGPADGSLSVSSFERIG